MCGVRFLAELHISDATQEMNPVCAAWLLSRGPRMMSYLDLPPCLSQSRKQPPSSEHDAARRACGHSRDARGAPQLCVAPLQFAAEPGHFGIWAWHVGL